MYLASLLHILFEQKKIKIRIVESGKIKRSVKVIFYSFVSDYCMLVLVKDMYVSRKSLYFQIRSLLNINVFMNLLWPLLQVLYLPRR